MRLFRNNIFKFNSRSYKNNNEIIKKSDFNIPYFDIIVCTEKNGGISNKKKIPWYNKNDLLYFNKITTFNDSYNKKNTLIMGKNTADEIINNNILLKNRQCIYLSKKINITKDNENKYQNQFIIKNSLEDSLIWCSHNSEKIFIVGGKQLYDYVKNHQFLNNIYLSQIDKKIECDEFFDLGQNKKLIKEDEINGLKLMIYNNENNGELNYLKLMKKILDTGIIKETRNGKTISLFSETLKFSLKSNIPILTTKKISIKSIFEELMFFLKGETNSKILENLNVNIWKLNTSRDFLDNLGFFDYNEGDMGPMYGYQWRSFGKDYKSHNTCGFDQLNYLINELVHNKNSRRLLITTFNPKDAFFNSVLYPCHGIVLQIYIDNDNFMNCNMYQRSADYFLGVPFNITSYSLLIYLLCDFIKKKYNIIYNPGFLNIIFGDVHIYLNHLNQVHTQIKRIPFEFPNLLINNSNINNITDYKWSHLKFINYISHDKIIAPMSA